MFLRIFSTAVDPSDLSEVRRIFTEDIKPVFESFSACVDMELMVATEKNAGGLIDGAAVSRWTDLDALSAAVESRAVSESMVRILPLLQVEPVISTFEVME